MNYSTVVRHSACVPLVLDIIKPKKAAQWYGAGLAALSHREICVYALFYAQTLYSVLLFIVLGFTFHSIKGLEKKILMTFLYLSQACSKHKCIILYEI